MSLTLLQRLLSGACGPFSDEWERFCFSFAEVWKKKIYCPREFTSVTRSGAERKGFNLES
jgi:hypothetical protein